MKRVLIKKDVRYHLRESGSIKLEYLIDGEITPTFIITKLSKQKDKPQEYDIKGNNSEILEFFTYEILDSLKLLESEKVIIGYNPNDIVLILNLETGLIERMSHEEAEFNIKNYTSLPIIKIKDGKIYAKLNSEVFNNSYLCKNILI